MSSVQVERHRRWRRIGLIGALVLGVLVLLLGAAAVTATVITSRFARSQTLAPNLTIGNVAVAGMGAAEAREALQREYVPKLPLQIALTYPGGSVLADCQELGADPALDEAIAQAMQVGREPNWLERLLTHWRLRRRGVDLPVPMRLSQWRLHRTVAGLVEQVNREPKDAQITIKPDDTLDKLPGQSGLTLQVAESVVHLTRALQDPRTQEVALVVEEQPPNITAEDLAHLQLVLSAYSTPFHPYQRDRTHNLGLAMSKVKGTVLQPEEEFSVNQVVGPREPEQGYRAAIIFRDGDTVPEIGGGVCQVASTLYNVALLANLEILERAHHSRPVWYCPVGRDATVYYGQKDVRFRNTLAHPIMVLGEIRGDRLYAWIVGHAEDDYEVELIRSGYSRLGYGKRIIEDPNLPEGEKVVEREGHGGARATLTRKVYQDGELIKTETLHHDYYVPQTRVVRLGTGAGPAAEEPSLAPAPDESRGGPALQPPPAPLPPVLPPVGTEEPTEPAAGPTAPPDSARGAG